MNKLVLVSFLSCVSFSLAAQSPKSTAKPVAKPPATTVLLKTLIDSASYAIGYSVANISKSQGISSLNISLVARAFNDVMNAKPTLLTETTCNTVINRFMTAGQAATTTARTISSDHPEIKTLNDSVSYAICLNHASFFKQQGIKKLNTPVLVRAVKDVLGNKPTLITDVTANNIMNRLMIQIQEETVRPNINAGKSFLAANKKKPGVKTTASGLQYEVITRGNGIKPTAVDTFVCHYRGTLLNGTEFDASYNRNQPLVMGVSQVIRGWTEGLQLMPVGSKYKFYIPYTLAYGPFDNPPIPGGSMLIFELELLDVKKRKL